MFAKPEKTVSKRPEEWLSLLDLIHDGLLAALGVPSVPISYGDK